MKIKLDSIFISDFKGLSNFGYSFRGKSAKIFADNTVGKTTVYDAMLWTKFAKDSKGRTDFDVVPLVNGKPNKELTPTVEVTLQVDDELLTLKRKLVPKWTHKRGEAEKTFEGYTTEFSVNEVPVKANEYKAKIDSIVNEQTFKIVTNIDTFLTMRKPEQRAYLLNMIGDDIDPVTLCEGDPLMLRVVATMKDKNYKAEDLLKIVDKKIKEYSKEQNEIPARIDEASKASHTEISVDEIRKQIDALEKEITAGNPGKYDAIKNNYDMLQKTVNELKVHLLEIKTEYGKLAEPVDELFCDKCHQKIGNAEEYIAMQKDSLMTLGKTLRGTYDGMLKALASAEQKLYACVKPEVVAHQRAFMGELQGKLALAMEVEKVSGRVEELKQRNRELAQLITQQEGIKAGIDKLIKAKARYAQDKVDALFTTLKFRLFDEKVDGTLVDDCTAMINGNTPYESCSRSEAIRAGMEVIRAIQKFNGINCVVFIDNAESCTWLTDMDSQTIKLYVEAGTKELRIEVEE